MEGRCESNCGGDEMHPATFENEEETGLKLDDDDDDEINEYLLFYRTKWLLFLKKDSA